MEGTFTAASKITGTLGHGLASLTLDERYNHDRARRRAQEAQNVSEGIKQVGRGRGRYWPIHYVVLMRISCQTTRYRRVGVNWAGASMRA